jgi:CelD/BcsL family acetyltransferase involved in cellulose biosynthesis
MSIASSPATHVARLARSPATEVLVETIDDPSSLERLCPAWTRLWARCPQASAFLSPHWLLPWWRHLGEGALATVTVHCAGELVALAPMYRYRHPASGRRHLFPIGIGTTDHLDMLVCPGWEQTGLAAILAHFAERDDWELLEFPQLRRDSPLLRAPLPSGWRGEVIQGEVSPVLALRGARALPVPGALAQNLRTARHRAERAGTLTHELANAQSLPEILHALAQLHARRWAERNQPGVLAAAAVQAFHREAAPALLEAGLLRLHALRLDGAVVAVLYALADPPSCREPRHSYYLGGFDPAARAISPGTLLIAHAIEQAMSEGACAFDFLRGAEPYKYRWGAVDEPTWTLRVTPGPPRR